MSTEINKADVDPYSAWWQASYRKWKQLEETGRKDLSNEWIGLALAGIEPWATMLNPLGRGDYGHDIDPGHDARRRPSYAPVSSQPMMTTASYVSMISTDTILSQSSVGPLEVASTMPMGQPKNPEPSNPETDWIPKDMRPELQGGGIGGEEPERKLKGETGVHKGVTIITSKPSLLDNIKGWFYEENKEDATESVEGTMAAEAGDEQVSAASELPATEDDSLSPAEEM